MTEAGSSAAETDLVLARSSRVMAVGTVASRATGFLRTAVIAAAIGSGVLGDAYNVANTTPNILYELLLGGVLTSVVVPLLVQAAQHDGDGGEAYAQRLLTLVTLVLGGLAVLAVLAAPLVVRLYTSRFGPEQLALATTFARFFFPQILFYGLGATIGAILNTRGRFAAPMWAPVLNNVVVIATGLLFLAIAGGRSTGTAGLSRTETYTLAIGTTAGIVAQTVALVPALRATGFRWRPRWDLGRVGLSRTGRLAGWVVLYVAANQAGYLVIVKLATAAAEAARLEGVTGAGFSAYAYAFLLFQLPHAVVAVSVITALLPRMSRHAADGRLEQVRADLSTGLRLAGVALVPAALGLVVLAHPLATVVFAHGRIPVADARLIGDVLAAFALGLVPFSAFQVQLRAFYALHDTRTPALINVAVNAVNVGVDVLLYATLAPQHRVVGLALGYAASYGVGLALTTVVLRRRLGGLDGRVVVRTFVRLFLAAALAVAAAGVLAWLVGLAVGSGPGGALLALLPAVTAGVALFVLAAGRMRVTEVTTLIGGLQRRARG